MMLLDVVAHAAVDLAGWVPGQVLPNPAPKPPGGEAQAAIDSVLGMIKWGAGVSLVAAFFGGVALFAGGRLVDHHRTGQIGTRIMMSAVGGAILYACGYSLLTMFAK